MFQVQFNWYLRTSLCLKHDFNPQHIVRVRKMRSAYTADELRSAPRTSYVDRCTLEACAYTLLIQWRAGAAITRRWVKEIVDTRRLASGILDVEKIRGGDRWYSPSAERGPRLQGDQRRRSPGHRGSRSPLSEYRRSAEERSEYRSVAHVTNNINRAEQLFSGKKLNMNNTRKCFDPS